MAIVTGAASRICARKVERLRKRGIPAVGDNRIDSVEDMHPADPGYAGIAGDVADP
ncbi:hypothetical protein [uncultured Arthrobacter sp.]|uniref:hypothetical protein n=1 Tax=uncultured Arthrobacter sp. TaxID=114050 RepID=UPI0028D475D5|nr:hypothetical protein [uncultured Arthrobacter sp.]